MEQAVNTFSKGLQLDSHPMVQGNESLTDCLNGTFITMNGNEIILQNDMGNRRVDNAYLPSGYEPVGVKEYGGIIYIAAYNPITNRSQIGSFPSPERKINELDDEGLDNNIQYRNDLSLTYKNPSLNNLICLKQDSVLYPLTRKNSLHAGDKFVIYTSDDSDDSGFGEFSNYENTIDVQRLYVKTPKNKKYTLSVGILNSQNQFVDITKTLCRWEGNTLISTDDYSDDIKFNIGYFISSSKPSSINTINDNKLIEERQKLAINTYSYKLVGPMYLKVSLNHIESFSYNIYGNTNEDKTKAELFVEGFITYNCQDGVPEVLQRDPNFNDPTYYTYDEGIPNNSEFPGFYLYRCDTNPNNKSEVTLSSQSDKPEDGESNGNGPYYKATKSVYDPKTNLYTVKIVRQYQDVEPTDKTNKIYNYVLGVIGYYDKTYLAHLGGLSTKGNIDFNLLGSGKVKLETWRFINDMTNESTTLTYGFSAYPKYGQRFQNLKFIFVEYPSNVRYILDGLQLNNGRSVIQFNWSDLKGPNGNPAKLSKRKLYKVIISWDVFDEEEEKIIKTEYLEKEKTIKTEYLDSRTDYLDTGKTTVFFLTTELFNDCYSQNSPNFINNYVNPESEEQQKIKDEKLNIKIGINYNIVNNSKSGEEEEKISKKLLNINPELSLKEMLYIKYEREYILNLKSSPELYIINEELYPSYIKINEDTFSNVNITEFTINSDYQKPIVLGVNKSNNDSEILNSDSFIDIGEFTHENNSINGKIKYIDLFKAEQQKKKKEILNAFDSTEKFIDAFAGENAMENRYGGLYLDFDSRGSVFSARDDHYVHLIWNQKEPVVSQRPEGELPSENAIRLDSEHQDRPYGSKLSDYKERFYNELNSHLDKNQVFIYSFVEDGVQSIAFNNYVVTNHRRDSDAYNSYYNARVWWRTGDDKWAIFYNIYNVKENESRKQLDKFIKNNFPKIETNVNGQNKSTYPIYCAYNSYYKDLGVPHDKKYAYNDRYSINIDGQIEYTYEGESNFVLGIDEDKDPVIFKPSLSDTEVRSFETNDGWEEVDYNSEYPEYNPKHKYFQDNMCNYKGKSYKLITVSKQETPPAILISTQKTISYIKNLIQLDSSESFQDDVNSVYSDMPLDCIDINSGNDVDLDGNKLDKNTFYYPTEKGLVRLDTSEQFFKVDPEITRQYVDKNHIQHDINAILFNFTFRKSTPKFRFDITGNDSDDFTSLDYSNIIVVPSFTT